MSDAKAEATITKVSEVAATVFLFAEALEMDSREFEFLHRPENVNPQVLAAYLANEWGYTWNAEVQQWQ